MDKQIKAIKAIAQSGTRNKLQCKEYMRTGKSHYLVSCSYGFYLAVIKQNPEGLEMLDHIEKKIIKSNLYPDAEKG